MSDPGTAVVIEDDVDMRHLVDAVLKQSGFDVLTAATGREGVELVRTHETTIVTLDVGLPDMDGYEVLRRIRKFSNCYVIMLTARSGELDTLTALHSGADDFVSKPFRPRELRARIGAMLRRPRAHHPAAEAGAPAVRSGGQQLVPVATARLPAELHHNGLVLDPNSRTALLAGTELRLTRSEFDLLHEMVRSGGAVRTKADLVRIVRGSYYPEDAYISDADERAVEVHIGNLRRKLKEDPRQPRWLMTVRGVGYRLAPPTG